MEKIIKYFNKNEEACEPNDAVKVVIQELDDDGNVIKEAFYFKA